MLGFLCYNALSDNTAIFIDEPELSLHQDWQEILLPLLLKQETGNQFFVATHSEFIYDQFPDKEFILNLEGN
jgi:predicted ATP-dependent endonuclease of OLD family